MANAKLSSLFFSSHQQFPFLFHLLFLISFLILPQSTTTTASSLALISRAKRASGSGADDRAAFDLLRLEQQLHFLDPRHGGTPLRPLRDEPTKVEPEEEQEGIDAEEEGTDKDNNCRQKCNMDLRMGLDMVKAHSAFGSIGVPSVLDQLDLQLFCRLDSAHDQCLIGCGYQVQFNLRNFVCKRRRDELLSHLDCFAAVAPQLRRQCGVTRCGPYTELELNMLGVGQRCRTLLCDLDCTRQVLAREGRCREGGRPAGQYLLAYSQMQVSSWLHEMLGAQAAWQQWPRSCAKLLCGIDGNGSSSNTRENGGPRGILLQAENTRSAGGTTNCTLPELID